MNPENRKSSLLVLLAGAVFLSPCAVFAATKVEPDKPKIDDIKSPQVTGVVSKSTKQKDWLEVEAKFKVEMAPEPKNKTCDHLTVKWYIAVENPDKVGTYLKLTKEVEYVNIPLKEEVYCSVYLSPASIRRLTGFELGGKRAVKYVAYEVLLDGKPLAEITDKGPAKWWSAASEKIADCATVPLLNKLETPFANAWWDRYAEIKAKTSP